MTQRRKRSPVRKRIESKGVRKRLGRPVKDATEPLTMPLTSRDLTEARRKRRAYDVDEPENFGECVLATCVSKVAGAEVLIMRSHAFVALPDDEHTLRYQLSGRSQQFVRLNDEDRLDEIAANQVIELLPPTPKERLVAQRSDYHKRGGWPAQKENKGTGTKVGPRKDPYRGIYRNGRFSTD